jgi:hypothetical protein
MTISGLQETNHSTGALWKKQFLLQTLFLLCAAVTLHGDRICKYEFI